MISVDIANTMIDYTDAESQIASHQDLHLKRTWHDTELVAIVTSSPGQSSSVRTKAADTTSKDFQGKITANDILRINMVDRLATVWNDKVFHGRGTHGRVFHLFFVCIF